MGGMAPAGLPELAQRLDAFIPEVMRATRTPGFNVAIALDGSICYSRAFGFADLRAQMPMKADAVLPGGSLTKLYTATAVLQLAERGDLDIYEPITSIIPNIPVRNPLGERHITLYDLLTYRSGLRIDTAEMAGAPPPSLADYITREIHRDIRREYQGVDESGRTVSRWGTKTGTTYEYSNLGLAILGYAVEQRNVDGLDFGAYVREHITKPLGMDSTIIPAAGTSTDELQLRERVPTGYARFGNWFVPSPTLYTNAVPAGGLLTTPEDHLRWLLAIMNDGAISDTRILAPASVRFMLQRQATTEPSPGHPIENGLVMELTNIGREDFYFGEPGLYPWGWWTDSRAYPELGLAIVATVNKWDMLRWFNPPGESPLGLVADFVAQETCSARRDRASAPREQDWAWKLAYVAGIVLAERTAGLLGLAGEVDSETFARHLSATTNLSCSPQEPRFSEDAFMAGVRDVLATDLTPRALQELMASPDRLSVPSSELRALGFELGGRPSVPVPMPYYARRTT